MLKMSHWLIYSQHRAWWSYFLAIKFDCLSFHKSRNRTSALQSLPMLKMSHRFIYSQHRAWWSYFLAVKFDCLFFHISRNRTAALQSLPMLKMSHRLIYSQHRAWWSYKHKPYCQMQKGFFMKTCRLACSV